MICLGDYYQTDCSGAALNDELTLNGYIKEYPFLNKIEEEDIIRNAGSEFYYIVFSDLVQSVSVDEFIFNDNEEYYREIYVQENNDHIVLCGNISDIIPNFKVNITDINGNVTEYIPFISLKDGYVATDDDGKIVDYTKYDILNNTGG